MCRRVDCASCGKPTFAGCGNHIESVLGDVPKPDRCSCRDEPTDQIGGADPKTSSKSFWKALVGG
jgi:hypothetical protein